MTVSLYEIALTAWPVGEYRIVEHTFGGFGFVPAVFGGIIKELNPETMVLYSPKEDVTLTLRYTSILRVW